MRAILRSIVCLAAHSLAFPSGGECAGLEHAEFVNWGVNAGGCYDCGSMNENLVDLCLQLCLADAKCKSFETATDAGRDDWAINCCIEHADTSDDGEPNRWIGPRDVDGRCKKLVRSWTTYEPALACVADPSVDTSVCKPCGDSCTNTEESQPGRDKWLDDGCPEFSYELWVFLMVVAFIIAFLWCFIAFIMCVVCRLQNPRRKKHLMLGFGAFLVVGATVWHVAIAPAVYWDPFVYLMGLVGDLLGVVCGCACHIPGVRDRIVKRLDGPSPAIYTPAMSPAEPDMPGQPTVMSGEVVQGVLIQGTVVQGAVVGQAGPIKTY